MGIDAITYLASYFIEDFKVKNHDKDLSQTTLLWVEVYFPLLSILVLLGFMIYIFFDAIGVLSHPPDHTEVDVMYIVVFSVINLLVNFICISFMYIGQEEDTLVDKIVMDVCSNVPIDQEKFMKRREMESVISSYQNESLWG